MLDVFSNAFLVPTDSAYAVPPRPKAPAEQSASCLQNVPVDSDCALALQKSNRVGNAVLQRNTQQHINMVWHRFPFQKLDTPLLTQLSKYLPSGGPHWSDSQAAALRLNRQIIITPPSCPLSIPGHAQGCLAGFRDIPRSGCGRPGWSVPSRSCRSRSSSQLPSSVPFRLGNH